MSTSDGPDDGPLPGGSRRAARERALELLYEAEARGVPGPELLDTLPVAPDAFAAALVAGVDGDRAMIDEALQRASHRWDLHRMPVIDRCVLRLATHELAHRSDVPTRVVINEAVELAKRYSTDDSGRFVNGVLSSLAEELRGGSP